MTGSQDVAPAKLSLLASLEEHTNLIWQLNWNASGSQLASCGSDSTIKIWAYSNDRLRLETSLSSADHQRSIRSVAFAGENLMASCSFDKKTILWTTNNKGEWTQGSVLEGHENEVKCVAWKRLSATAYCLATCGRDKSIWMWEIETEEHPGEEPPSTLSADCIAILQEHTQDVKFLLWDTQDSLLYSCSSDESIKVWSEGPGEWECIKSLVCSSEQQGIVWALDMDVDGRLLVSVSEGGFVKIWSKAAEWSCVYSVRAGAAALYSVAWSKAAPELLAVCGADDGIYIYRWTAERSLVPVARQAGAHKGDVNCIRWHPSQTSLLASCGDDLTVKLWALS